MSENVLSPFLRFAEKHPESPALFDGTLLWTYGWLRENANAALKLLENGDAFECPHQPVPRIGLFCPNGVDHVVWAIAILLGGGCLVPIPQELTETEREELVQRTGLHAVLSGGGLIWRPAMACKDIQLTAGVVAGTLVLLQRTSSDFPEHAFSSLRPALIRFSSGTTGKSKGVVLSHQTILDRIASANRRLQITQGDRILWTLSMAHHFAVSIVLYLNHGAGIILEESHLGDALLDRAVQWGATVMYGAPFHYRLLANVAAQKSWSTLRLAVSTAAPLPEIIARGFQKRYGVPLTQGFGIIEAGLPLLNSDDAAEFPTYLGKPGDFEVALIKSDGTLGEEGELCLRGPGMFDAYLSPWRTRSEVMKDGWFHSGDLAERNSAGNLRLCGRLKSVLNIAGMKCFPEEIEEALSRFPGVCEVRVSGEENERWGTFPVAELVLREAAHPPSHEDLTAHCRRILAPYKVPLRFKIVESLDKTASGKIRR